MGLDTGPKIYRKHGTQPLIYQVSHPDKRFHSFECESGFMHNLVSNYYSDFKNTEYYCECIIDFILSVSLLVFLQFP